MREIFLFGNMLQCRIIASGLKAARAAMHLANEAVLNQGRLLVHAQCTLRIENICCMDRQRQAPHPYLYHKGQTAL